MKGGSEQNNEELMDLSPRRAEKVSDRGSRVWIVVLFCFLMHLKYKLDIGQQTTQRLSGPSR